MSEESLKQLLRQLLHRKTDSNKYDFGHVLVIGGSSGMIGAPILASLSALRAGAGMVTVASRVAEQIAGHVPELITHELSKNDAQAADQIESLVQKRHINVLAIGPGLGPEYATLIRHIVTNTTLPMVLDAGALNAFSETLDELTTAAAVNNQIILTPHSGEYSRLTGQAVASIDAQRQTQAIDFAHQQHLTLLLKGSHTIVAGADGAKYINQTGNPGLASAGSGDVLTGIIAGLIGQRLTPFQAAAGGAYLHGKAADSAVASKTEPGLIATDLIHYLPQAYQSLN
jgi:hydroxyethylthiazole kinase-like uncharacterized protein yjeF